MARKSIDWMKTMPELLNEWDYEKNNIMPSDISIWSKNKVWWKCKYGHEWASTMNSRQKKSGCPYCAGLLPIVGVNDLQTTNPELIKEWDYQKNIIKPYEIKVGSGMKIWWKCKEGHSWEATPNHRKKGQGCPYCSGKKVLAGFNDINTLRPNIAKEWDYEKNENKTPDMYTVRSGSKVWWRCKEGHSWKADDACFWGLSIDAKLLYAIFLDRVSLSIKNGWVDENGRVFIYYSVINICEILNCGTQKACKLLDELETFGALERRRQGLGKPNRIYLKKVF